MRTEKFRSATHAQPAVRLSVSSIRDASCMCEKLVDISARIFANVGEAFWKRTLTAFATVRGKSHRPVVLAPLSAQTVDVCHRGMPNWFSTDTLSQ
jgi:hypothetical protein